MSMIVHRCRAPRCGHREAEHVGRRGTCSQGLCPAGPHRPDLGPPEVAPTFDTLGRRVARLLRPGSDGQWQLTTCDCRACQDLYAQLTAAGAA